MEWFIFLCGTWLGCFIGVFIMCLAQVSKRSDDVIMQQNMKNTERHGGSEDDEIHHFWRSNQNKKFYTDLAASSYLRGIAIFNEWQELRK